MWLWNASAGSIWPEGPLPHVASVPPLVSTGLRIAGLKLALRTHSVVYLRPMQQAGPQQPVEFVFYHSMLQQTVLVSCRAALSAGSQQATASAHISSEVSCQTEEGSCNGHAGHARSP
jgi:hypothetical protein